MEFNENLTIEEWTNNELAISIFNNKYRYENETFMQTVRRISGGNEAVMRLILDKKYLPGGRICANRGLENEGRKVSLSNCYVLPPVQDNLESIFDTAKEMAKTFSRGGGVGLSISNLSFKGAKVNNAAKYSSGAVSFMDLYSLVTGLISQNGRRGATMLSMDISHPDIEEFITVKNDLGRVTKANISVQVNDKFMEAVKNDEYFELKFTRKETGEEKIKSVKARDLFHLICKNAWDTGEPGVLFWDNIENYNLVSEHKDFKYAGVNPCVTGDTEILTKDGNLRIDRLVGKEVEIWNGYEWSTVIPKITGKDQPIRYIEVSNGLSLRCTDYHKFILSDGSRVEAKDLKIGDIIATYYYPTNYEFQDNILYKGTEVVKDLTIVKNVPFGIANTVYCFNEPKNHSGIFNGIMTAQCAEEPLPAYGACLLGSINLSAFIDNPFTDNATFNIKQFKSAVRIIVIELNTILDEGIKNHPLQQQKQIASDWRQIGLGVMGISDALIKLGCKYGSQRSLDIANAIGFTMADTAIETSAYLAKEYGSFPKYDKEAILNSEYFKYNTSDETKSLVEKYGLRNSALLTIAPTGSLSNVLGISGGIEPIFANSYTRKTETLYDKDTYYKIYTPIVKEYMDKFSIEKEEDLPDYFITAPEINYRDRIKMQSVWQSHIDASISSTVNLPETATIEDIEDLYMNAWESKLKGITVFRDNCRRIGVLTTDKKDKNKENTESDTSVQGTAEHTELARGEIIKVSDDVVGLKRKLMTGCGSLHCIALFDKSTGNMVETYLSKGSTGGCNNFMVGLSRMISLSARAGVSIYDIVDQLRSTGSCPSYAVRKAVHNDTSIGSCCPMAVGNALIDMYNEFNHLEKYTNKNDIKSKAIESTVDEHILESVTKASIEEQLITYKEEELCPQCGAKLDHIGGCDQCNMCGWTKCD